MSAAMELERAEVALAAAEALVVRRRGELDQTAAHRRDWLSQIGSLVNDPPAGQHMDTDTAAVAGAKLAAQEDVARRVVADAESRVPPARRVVLAARAGVLAQRAEALALVVSQRREQTARLLAQLAELEGCEFAPVAPERLPVGAYRDPVPWRVPLTAVVETEQSRLETIATRWEQTAESGTDEQVGAAVARPMLGPSEVEAAALSGDWATLAPHAVRVSRPGFRGVPPPPVPSTMREHPTGAGPTAAGGNLVGMADVSG